MLIGSILDSVKKRVNVQLTDDAFDEDILVEINSAFSTLTEIGLGPVEGFAIEDNTATWDDYETAGVPSLHLSSVKTYIALKVRRVFDPPASSFAVASMDRQIQQLEWRLNTTREAAIYVSESS
jgi:hypothetical protein